MATYEIIIDMDAKCAECGKPGANKLGLCLGCFFRILDGKPMQSKRGKELAATVKQRIRHVLMQKMTELFWSHRDE